ncbi:multidrug resistance protein, MATE family [Rhodopseudomonas pseudopalustris]|uniref:Multidrug-efflux transporter n=2 Tax=Rhodopseudomonas pseudopalustris TaxID=1513892 RepID=A0A1H8LXJ0_9BRAD|nr:multidrug resistance protein, MATE family [Rhodopseudomonas pseudopalustris]
MVRAMTSSDLDLAAGAPAPAKSSAWRTEIVETLWLAVPMALTQLGQIAMMTTDLALIGRLGDAAVAAAALAHTVWLVAFMLGIGLASAVAPLAAQAYGARSPRKVRASLRVGLWASLIAGVPLTLSQFYGEELLRAAGQDARTAQLAGHYLHGLAWSLVPGWMFIAFRSFMGAVNRPEPALWIMFAAVPINAVLAYALIHGEFGLPALGILGAGLATALVSMGNCVAAAVVCVSMQPFRKYRVFGQLWRLDAPLMKRLLGLGLPISGASVLEYGLFGAAALLMGQISTTALAAHQIALQVAAIMFMVPMGISLAATVRVGHAVGRHDPAGARRAGFAAIGLGLAFMALMTLLVALTRYDIPQLFLGDTVTAAETAQLTASLLVVGASFFMADGLQVVANGALRGRNDTRIPLLFAALSFWAIGFPCSYLLAFPAGFGPFGVWIGLAIGLTVYAALLVWRFHLLTREPLPGLARG